MWKTEDTGGVVEKITCRLSQQHMKTVLRVFYSLFLICMGIMIWQLIVLNFDNMTIAMVIGLLFSQIAIAIEKLFYEGDRFGWSEFLGR